jgi:hypothetical protein
MSLSGTVTRSLWILVSISLIATAQLASAQEPVRYDRPKLDAWLAQYATAKPDFKPGDVLTAADSEKLKPFVPPGLLEKMMFPGFQAPIIERRDHRLRTDFMACTEKYQAQSRLDADGILTNNVCGQPFANSAINVGDPLSGVRAQWNFDRRWQNYGHFALNFLFIFDKFGGDHTGAAPTAIEGPPLGWIFGLTFTSQLPTDVSADFAGGGHFERILGSFYQRTYLDHLPQHQAEGGTLDNGDSRNFRYKEFDGFFSPFDVRGQVIIFYRYADPKRADDAWVYDPRERRVRRISVEVKSDSLEGSDTTAEDFNTFSGRMVQWNWHFLGWKDMLAVTDSKYDYPKYFGPNGEVPNDVWSLRRCAVVERTPKIPNHPYSSVVMFWDAETWHAYLGIAFDRNKRLYKLWTFQTAWSEDVKAYPEINHGIEAPVLHSIVVTDFSLNRATIFPAYGAGYPNATPDRVNRLFDISKLEESHR